MKILVTGRGVSGSWKVRGEQLGAAIGATVEPKASKIAGFDLVILVKRERADLLYRLHASGVPIVWDVVDSWPQPAGNSWDQAQCMGWLRAEVAKIRPMGIVAATKVMAEDCAEFGVPVLSLPHHARPGLTINPIRREVKTVGYEGGTQYLGRWERVLEAECKARGWRWVMNPPSLCELDIGIAVREQDGYAAKQWKSNVKLANFQGSGTPCVLNGEAGYRETQRGGVRWANTLDEMRAAFDALTPENARREAAVNLLGSRIALEDVAAKYKAWLASKF